MHISDHQYLPEPGDKVLLVNPPIYDTRLHWHQWLQPVGLLKLATYARRIQADARLVDALAHQPDQRIRRQRVAVLQLDDSTVNKWRFGETTAALTRRLRELQKDGWCPDRIYVECLVTFWWEGTAETARIVREVFRDTSIYLIGDYGQLAPAHVVTSMGTDVTAVTLGPDVTGLPTDLSVLPQSPRFAYISLADSSVPPEAVVADIATKLEQSNVRNFAFIEHGMTGERAERYARVLELIAWRGLKLSLYALGNISPFELVAHPETASLMRQAGYKQIVFADDREQTLSADADEKLVQAYREAASLLDAAGFPLRTDNVVGSICIGRQGEDLEARAALATHVAHHIGSVIPWAYQPRLQESPEVPLEDQNGKLFPLRARNGLKYRDYMDFLGLTAILNSKYRERTFDFLGHGLIPSLVRQTMARRGWDPAPDVKGTLSLPAKPTTSKR